VSEDLHSPAVTRLPGRARSAAGARAPERSLGAIVGVAESDLGVLGPERTPWQLQAQAACAALGEAGLDLSDVDGLLVSGSAYSWSPVVSVAEYLGIEPRFTVGTNLGGASFESHVGHAARAVSQGLCEVALITYGSTQRSNPVPGPPADTRGPEQFERVHGLATPVGAYALAARRHMHQYGTTPEQLAEVAVAARQWAALNPKAYAREPIEIADVLSSRIIADPLHKLDCCLVTDGGGAVVVTSEAVARGCSRPVWIRGHGEAHTHLTIANMPDLTVTPAARSGPAALEMAGMTLADIDLFELYDSFTITVLLTLESLGICGPGEAGDFVSGGRIAPGGDFPLNTNGGGLSYCHPGMYGIFLLIEAVRQLRGERGEGQVPGASTALVHATGGVLSAAATVVLTGE
jgi:acetyl-CoA acetyltransferase